MGGWIDGFKIRMGRWIGGWLKGRFAEGLIGVVVERWMDGWIWEQWAMDVWMGGNGMED